MIAARRRNPCAMPGFRRWALASRRTPHPPFARSIAPGQLRETGRQALRRAWRHGRLDGGGELAEAAKPRPAALRPHWPGLSFNLALPQQSSCRLLVAIAGFHRVGYGAPMSGTAPPELLSAALTAKRESSRSNPAWHFWRKPRKRPMRAIDPASRRWPASFSWRRNQLRPALSSPGATPNTGRGARPAGRRKSRKRSRRSRQAAEEKRMQGFEAADSAAASSGAAVATGNAVETCFFAGLPVVEFLAGCAPSAGSALASGRSANLPSSLRMCCWKAD